MIFSDKGFNNYTLITITRGSDSRYKSSVLNIANSFLSESSWSVQNIKSPFIYQLNHMPRGAMRDLHPNNTKDGSVRKWTHEEPREPSITIDSHVIGVDNGR